MIIKITEQALHLLLRSILGVSNRILIGEELLYRLLVSVRRLSIIKIAKNLIIKHFDMAFFAL
jgi:hypothetical protein